MATDALGMYSWAIEHGITRETHYCSDCCYDVLDAGVVVGSVDDEGIYHGPAPGRQRLGYLGRDPLDLVIELDAGGTLLLVEQIPSDFRPWRWDT